MILVSHSMEDIAKLADKVIVLNEGKLEMMGTPREVFRNEQRLNQIGLTVPQMTSLFHRLGGLLPESGIRKEIFTVEEGAEEILRLLGIRRGTGGTDL